MAAPKVDAPENTPAPEKPRTIDGVPVTDGPVRDKDGTFLRAAYPVGNGMYRVDRGTKVGK
jgi:hypothetical protein